MGARPSVAMPVSSLVFTIACLFESLSLSFILPTIQLILWFGVAAGLSATRPLYSQLPQATPMRQMTHGIWAFAEWFICPSHE